jgi:hypothetical protein
VIVVTEGKRLCTSATNASSAPKAVTVGALLAGAPAIHEAQLHSKSLLCAAGSPALAQRSACRSSTWNNGAMTSVLLPSTASRAASKVRRASRGWPWMAITAWRGAVAGDW